MKNLETKFIYSSTLKLSSKPRSSRALLLISETLPGQEHISERQSPYSLCTCAYYHNMFEALRQMDADCFVRATLHYVIPKTPLAQIVAGDNIFTVPKSSESP